MKPGSLVVLTTAVVAMAVAQAAAGQRETPLREATGITAAHQRLGEAAPTGRGVVMGHVEGQSGQYMPDVDDGRFDGVTLTPRSGASEPFGHATHTAGIIYGRQGLAPGVETVHHFAVQHWLTDGYLRAGQLLDPSPGRVEPGAVEHGGGNEPRVWSHSWISDAGPGSEDAPRLAHVLRRADHAIDRRGVVMCVGVNNGRRSRVPAMLASSYNAIAVGAAGGDSSGGYTWADGEGRSKPDVIAPRRLTSYATPVVAAIAARLVEAADALGDERDAPYAGRPEVIKAVLMTGAVKPRNWSPAPGRPPDQHLGAGVVHLDRALAILEHGPQPTGNGVPNTGWSCRLLEPGRTDTYELEVGEGAAELSALVTWHRRIAGGLARDAATGVLRWNETPRLARIDLRVHYTDANGQSGVIGRSTSDVDNVQHVYIDQPPPGRYRIEVTRRDDGLDEPWAYALAWRSDE